MAVVGHDEGHRGSTVTFERPTVAAIAAWRRTTTTEDQQVKTDSQTVNGDRGSGGVDD
jgi:hypothetical protein